MTRFIRRLYTGFAIALFLVMAPLVVAWTSGYRWTGWRSGFTQTGSLYITSQPRATLYLNGKEQGLTPQRIAHLPPGSYVAEVKKSGYATWTSSLRINPSSAISLGPIQLFPSAFTLNYQDLPGTSQLLSADQDLVFGISPSIPSTVQLLWPTSTTTYTVPFIPNFVAGSSNHQNILFSNETDAAIFTSGQHQEPWILTGVTSPLWASTTQTLLYGLHNGHVVRFDTFTRTTTQLGLAESFTLIGDTVWSSLQHAEVTRLYRQQAFGQNEPSLSAEIPGHWSVDQRAREAIVLMNADTLERREIRLDTLTNEVRTLSFGTVDALWWPSKTQPPVWRTGTDLLTFDTEGQQLLVDRSPRAVTFATWIVPNHILLTTDERSVRIQSISNRQGRGILLERSFDEPITLLGFSLASKTLVIRSQQGLSRMITLQW